MFDAWRRIWVAAAVALLLSSIALASKDEVEDTDLTPKTLRLVVEVCRHGDRSTLSTFPNDPLPYWKWPQIMPGQLTPVGERAHFQLGRELRKRYVERGFLDRTYNLSQMYVRSSDVDRTILSATAQLAGLYPEGTGSTYDVREEFGERAYEEFRVGLPRNWQIIPVHTKYVMDEHALIPGIDCPLHKQMRSRTSLAERFQDRLADVERICEKLLPVTGLSECDLSTIADVNDVWTCDEHHDIPVNASVTKAERAKVRELADLTTEMASSTEALQRMRSGTLLHEIRTRLQIAAGDEDASSIYPPKPDLKFMLLSAHDTTLGSLLSALQIYDGHNPPYNSTVFFELHEVKDSFYVKIEYNSVVQQLPNCSTICPLDRYIELTASRTIDEAEREELCTSNGFVRLNVLTLLGLALGGVLLVVVAFWCVRCFKKGYQPIPSSDEEATAKAARRYSAVNDENEEAEV